MNSHSNTEIDNETSFKTVTFSYALHCLETVKRYLMQQDGFGSRFEDSCPLDEDDLIEFDTVFDNKEFDDDDEEEGEVQLLKADLIHEDLKFTTRMEQHFLTHDPETERA
ncbi:hypothetical protein TNCV_4735171 [Trichonephila clavipes]|nr:hypothetical protein TNCV_4735171 [Trichonephila clavipes]